MCICVYRKDVTLPALTLTVVAEAKAAVWSSLWQKDTKEGHRGTDT